MRGNSRHNLDNQGNPVLNPDGEVLEAVLLMDEVRDGALTTGITGIIDNQSQKPTFRTGARAPSIPLKLFPNFRPAFSLLLRSI